MAENDVKNTSSSKVNGFLEKNRKVFIAVLVAVVVCLIGFIVAVTVSSKATEKNLSRIDEISFTLTDGSASLDEGELNARRIDALDKLQSLVNKGGITGARANLLSAELYFQQKKYEDALNCWKSAASKAKKSYIAPIALYQMGVCYEQLGNFDSAAESYKSAADSKDFPLVTHAKFSYGRVLENQGKTEEAIEVYTALNDEYPSDSWANLAKSRLIVLKISK